jgi:hypothetical protein
MIAQEARLIPINKGESSSPAIHLPGLLMDE